MHFHSTKRHRKTNARSPKLIDVRHRRNERVLCCYFSPPKTRHQLTLVIQVFLNLLPHVEDWTVTAAEE